MQNIILIAITPIIIISIPLKIIILIIATLSRAFLTKSWGLIPCPHPLHFVPNLLKRNEDDDVDVDDDDGYHFDIDNDVGDDIDDNDGDDEDAHSGGDA